MNAAENHPLGLVEIDNDSYHAGPGISSSHLHTWADGSPLHYWHKYLNPDREPEVETDAKRLGHAVHAAVLEPDLFESKYLVTPNFNRRTKDGRALYEEFLQENKDKNIITPEDKEICLAIRDRVYRHPTARGLLSGGKAEQSFYTRDAETGELIKCRFDYLQDSGFAAIDVKSTISASPEAFGRQVGNLRYDVSAAWYLDILQQLYGDTPEHWIWLAFEKEPPYAIGIYYAESDMLQRALATARRDFMGIVQHRRMNYWPDWGAEVMPLKLAAWVKR